MKRTALVTQARTRTEELVSAFAFTSFEAKRLRLIVTGWEPPPAAVASSTRSSAFAACSLEPNDARRTGIVGYE
jgi:hypothetical protein